jgi:tetratricopeptide (TPR) repeat protein
MRDSHTVKIPHRAFGHPLTLLLLLLLVLLCASSIPLAAFQTPLTAALEELNRGNVFEAIQKLKLTLRENKLPQAYYYLAGIYTRMGRYDSAYRYLSSAIQDNPTQAAYYDQLGLIRQYEGCRPEAMAAFKHALKLGMKSEEATVWRHIGDVHVDLLEWDKAIDAFRNSLRLRPDDAGTHLALGRIYVDRNDPAMALVELRAALAITPAVAGLHAALGRAYRAGGDSESAIAILKKRIEQDSSDQESRYILARTLLAAGRVEEGRQVLENYRQLQERITQTNTMFEAGVERAEAGDLAEAERLLREALKLAPRYAPVLQTLGAVLLNRGRAQPALEVFRQSLAVNPLNSETYLNMGEAYLRLGNLKDAVETTEKVLVIDDDDARPYTQLAEIYSRLNRPDQSRTALEKAAELRAQPRYRQRDRYRSEARRRNDAATVGQICGGPPSP